MTLKIDFLKKKLAILNKIFWIGFFSKKWTSYINKKKTNLVLYSVSKEITPLIKKYSEIKPPTSSIGKKVWVFWYAGVKNSPPIVKKCIEQMQQIDQVELIILDKNNLEDFFIWDENIKRKFNAGYISITHLSDIIRNQVLTNYGGFWFDATIFTINKEIINMHCKDSFYTIKHKDYAACSHFSKGLWSSFLIGVPPNHPFTSFISEYYAWYYKYYDYPFDYFMTDYIYFLEFKTFSYITRQINDIKPENKDVFFLAKHLSKSCDDKQWANLLNENSIQKLNWRSTMKKSKQNSYYYRMFTHEDKR